MTDEVYRYKAFISYSHQADRELATSIQKSLQILAKPWYRERAFEIFRDETNLSVEPDLWGTILDALSQSEYLILMCSPRAARSEWVPREVAWWLEHRDIDTIALALTEGDITWDTDSGDFGTDTSALPPNLYACYQGIPRFLDFREVRRSEHLDLGNKAFEEVLRPLAARLHAKTVEDMFGEIRRRHRQQMRWAVSALGLILMFLIGTVGFYVQSIRTSETALANSLAFTSEVLRESDPGRAFQVAAEAHGISADNEQASDALFKAAYQSEKGFLLWRKLLGDTDKLGDGELGDTGQAVAVSPDGPPDSRRIAVGMDDGKVHLFDSRGEPLGLVEHKSGVDTLTFQPGLRPGLLVATENQTLLYPLDDQGLPDEEKAESLPQLSSVREARFSPDGDFLLLGCDEDKTRIHFMDGAPPIPLQGGSVIALSADGAIIAVADGEEVILYDSRGVEQERRGGFTNDILALALSPDSNLLAVAFGQNQIQLIDREKDSVTDLRGHAMRIYNLAFSPDGRFLASASDDSRALVWDRQGKIVKTLYHPSIPGTEVQGPGKMHESNQLEQAVFFPAGDRVATVLLDGSVAVWFLGYDLRPSKRFPSTVNTTNFSRDGRMIISACADGSVHVNESFGSKKILRLEVLQERGVEYAAFTPDDQSFIACDEAGMLSRFDLAGKRIWQVKAHNGEVQSCVWSPDGTMILTAGFDGKAKLWRPDGKHIRTIAPSLEPGAERLPKYWSAEFSPDGKTLVTASDDVFAGQWKDGFAAQWKIDGTLLRRFDHGSQVLTAQSDATGKHLLTVGGGNSGEARIWDRRGNLLARLVHPEFDIPNGGALSSDGRRIATVTMEGLLRIWNSSGKKLLEFQTGDGWINHVAWSPDDRFVVTSGEGYVRIWPASENQLITEMDALGLPLLTTEDRADLGL
uniref:WD40 repeat n=1 Tax=Candidatus Kentrum sp. LFY TaxID=2126342 RepID=A0A450UZ74_9GAMM|nr:MAG: WD40 repeat [Candidatus Kentron sp. LFY]